MKLSYRGIKYDNKNSYIVAGNCQKLAKYRGISYHLFSVKQILIHHYQSLKYRGISYKNYPKLPLIQEKIITKN